MYLETKSHTLSSLHVKEATEERCEASEQDLETRLQCCIEKQHCSVFNLDNRKRVKFNPKPVKEMIAKLKM